MNLDAMTLEKIYQVSKQEEKIKDILLFGSRAKGTAKKGSDIDLAIIGDNLGFRDVCRFAMKLDELDLPYKIDIVNYNTITNHELKDHIDRVCISLVPDMLPSFPMSSLGMHTTTQNKRRQINGQKQI